jgi:phospholipid transport system transporter-binding protein
MQREGELLRVTGRLTMDAIGVSFKEAMQALEGKNWVVDLAQVESVDSSAVSMLLAWLRNARQHEAKLTFINVPENLRTLAILYGLADALPLDQSSQ